MRRATFLVFLLSVYLPAVALAEMMGSGQLFNQQQQPQYQQPQYQQPQQYQEQQLQQQQYQQYQQQQLQQQQLQQQQLQQQQLQQQQLQQQQLQQQQQYQQPQPYQLYQPQQQVPPSGSGSQPGGPCTVKLSTDRSTIHLMDPDGTERKHVPLGQDRVQKVFNSPDGTWSVAIYKIRGAQQYGFIALDLTKCEEQPPVDLPSIASSASFVQGEVVLSLEKGERRFKLKNQAIQ